MRHSYGRYPTVYNFSLTALLWECEGGRRIFLSSHGFIWYMVMKMVDTYGRPAEGASLDSSINVFAA